MSARAWRRTDPPLTTHSPTLLGFIFPKVCPELCARAGSPGAIRGRPGSPGVHRGRPGGFLTPLSDAAWVCYRCRSRINYISHVALSCTGEFLSDAVDMDCA